MLAGHPRSLARPLHRERISDRRHFRQAAAFTQHQTVSSPTTCSNSDSTNHSPLQTIQRSASQRLHQRSIHRNQRSSAPSRAPTALALRERANASHVSSCSHSSNAISRRRLPLPRSTHAWVTLANQLPPPRLPTAFQRPLTHDQQPSNAPSRMRVQDSGPSRGSIRVTSSESRWAAPGPADCRYYPGRATRTTSPPPQIIGCGYVAANSL